jgi:hypothetical protein
MDSSDESRTALREALQKSLDDAEWSWLIPHLERNSVVIVSQDLDLLDVGEKVAIDEVETVKKWIAEEKIVRPSPAKIEAWNETPKRRFKILVVQPYVLIQEKAN